jgi:uncharacterized protein YfiM (DUF2279 family)
MVVAGKDEKTATADNIGESDMSRAKWLSKAVGGLCVVVAAGFPTASQAQDSWTSADKISHFAYSAAMSSAAVKSHGHVVGAAISLASGAVKELIDLSGTGTPSFKDMTWNVVGVVTGAVLPDGFLVVPMNYRNGFLLTYSGSF